MKLMSFDRIDSRILDTLVSFTRFPSIGTARRNLLFPNLQILHWDCKVAPGDDYLCIFIGPRLTDLSILCASDSVMDITLHTLRDYAPHRRLEKFTLGLGGGGDSDGDYSWDIMDFCFQNNYEILTYVDLATFKGVTSWAWVILSEFPHLKILKTRIPIEDDEEDEEQMILQDGPHFPSLGALTLYSQGVDERSFESFAAELMPEAQRPYVLKHFGLELVEPFDGVTATQLIQQMAGICEPMALNSFSISVNLEFTEDPDIVLTSVEPLLACTHLQRIKLDSMPVTDLDNHAIREMVNAWAFLGVLDLGWDYERWALDSKVTLEGLIPLAELCPELTEIRIVLKPCLVSEQVQRRVDQMTFDNMVKKIFVNPWATYGRETTTGTALFLMKLFPDLVSVN
ncbi:hypothetical protein NLI96_g3587 [Meripilus lineatus]|uniref:Uncharacterized protein n=1 Tax=Meripilus lineatus TaxID=2056292 RepID=A0AAD5V8Q4_9APHY|nr:hypothetical protein NLI96_g3587 [Physisporinus lineatus]